MERIHVKGNTYCLKGKQLIPYYVVEEGKCVLFDTGRGTERQAIEDALAEAGLTPVGMILTHMHYDHNENTRYFKERYGIPAAMPRGEAEIIRNEASLKNHLFCFTSGLIRETERLQNLLCPIDRPIEWEENRLDFAGTTFRSEEHTSELQ